MPDQVRRPKLKFAVLTTFRGPVYFETYQAASNYAPAGEIVEVWESRNATGGSGDEDGFTEWRESFSKVEEPYAD